MKTTKEKFEQAKKLTKVLVNTSNIQSERYYFVLRIFQSTRRKLNKELELIRLSKIKKEVIKTEGQLYADAMEERRAIKDASHSFPLSNIVLGQLIMGLKNIPLKNAPETLIKKSIGICKCMEHAVKARLPLYILKMYAEESKRIEKEYNKYK